MSDKSSKPRDLIGQRFGRLEVLELVGTAPRVWRCRCTCGRTAQVTRSNLVSGNTRSCGCARIKVDLTGRQFGRLRVEAIGNVKRVRGAHPRRPWQCVCVCGTRKEALAEDLVRGRVRSCGCLAREMCQALGRRNRKQA